MLENLSGETRLFPIIGDPIRFVKSPHRLTIGFESRGYNGICVPMLVAQADLEVVMRGLSRSSSIGGLLITMPHKTNAYALCATNSERATLLGVVAEARRNQDGSWHGDNLDGLAFLKAQKDQGAQPEGARVLLVGAGGAGRAIAAALIDEGVDELIIHDASEDRANDLVRLLSRIRPGCARVGPPNPSGCDMVCNATPMGMADGDPLPVAPHLLSSRMFVGDVIAGHGTTPFIAAAQAAGCRTADGAQMVEAVQEMMLDFFLGA